MMLTLKITRRGEIRRTTVETPQTYDALRALLARVFEEQPESFSSITYVDDEGDNVSIANDADLMEAIRQVATDEKHMLRLHVRGGNCHRRNHNRGNNSNNNQRHGRCTRPRHCQKPAATPNPAACVPQFLQHVMSNPNVQNLMQGVLSGPHTTVVHNALCDVCDAEIAGTRYKCTVRPDYDLCEKCFKANENAVGDAKDNHPFRAITAAQALMEVLKKRGLSGVDAFFEHRPVAQTQGAPAPATTENNNNNDTTTTTKVEPAAEPVVEKPQPEPVKAPVVEQKPVVVEKPKEEEKPAAPLCTKKNSFERNLDTLESMGFTDREKNIQILVQNRNKLFETIQKLLA